LTLVQVRLHQSGLGVMARALQGNASSTMALEAGKKARPMAEAAWKHVEAMGGG
jgi:hypothetical protein